MQFYLTLTNSCNLKCKYCYGKACDDFGSNFHDLAIDYSLPGSISYDIDTVVRFLRKERNPILVFYGGEPLLEMDSLTEIMDKIRNARFIIQTNGLLLNRLEPAYVNRFETILISVDGDETLTDYYRGKGIVREVAKNVQAVRQNGFKGELVARMTVGEETEIDRQVLSLVDNPEIPVSSVHWQLDALFWQNDFPRRRFAEWSQLDYNPRLRNLVRIWLKHMRNTGEVMMIYPFVGVMQSLLDGEPSQLRCGAGWTMFNIQTDGNITPCPVMAGMKGFYVGNIREAEPNALRDAVHVSEPCTKCSIYSICGGRCLYANATKLWGKEGFSQVCNTVSNLIEALSEALPEVRKLLAKKKIRLEDFKYTKYNSCEIIP